jgi:hypothetical protein
MPDYGADGYEKSSPEDPCIHGNAWQAERGEERPSHTISPSLMVSVHAVSPAREGTADNGITLGQLIYYLVSIVSEWYIQAKL